MSYALMSTRALKSVREATTDELDELAREYMIVVTYLQRRLTEIDGVLTTRLKNKRSKNDNKNRESTKRVHSGSDVPATGLGDGGRSPVEEDGLPNEGSTGRKTGRDSSVKKSVGRINEDPNHETEHNPGIRGKGSDPYETALKTQV